MESRLVCSDVVVAVDLGSNSFHLLQAKLDKNEQLQPLVIQAHKVQLALAMKDGLLQADAIRRGLKCLREFASYTEHLHSKQLRIVATQALRVARNRDDFINPAQVLLGHSIDLIYGEEEAALAYLGVVSSDKSTGNIARLVVDIGGGSTELACGLDAKPDSCVSLPVGCVTWLEYFLHGEINPLNFDRAYQAARYQFAQVGDQLATSNGECWEVAIGCSGTLLAVEQVLICQGWSEKGISRVGLSLLKQALLEFNHIEKVSFLGLVGERRNIFASGLAIVLALFDGLGVETMQLSQSALREGVAWQLLKKIA